MTVAAQNRIAALITSILSRDIHGAVLRLISFSRAACPTS
jgi:hypothetical protein